MTNCLVNRSKLYTSIYIVGYEDIIIESVSFKIFSDSTVYKSKAYNYKYHNFNVIKNDEYISSFYCNLLEKDDIDNSFIFGYINYDSEKGFEYKEKKIININ